MGPIWQAKLVCYANRSQLGSQIHCPIGNQIRGPLGKEDVCPNFALTVTKFLFSHSGNCRAKANPPKPRSCPKFFHSGYLYSAPSRNLLRGALSPATVKEKCLKKLAERRHVVRR